LVVVAALTRSGGRATIEAIADDSDAGIKKSPVSTRDLYAAHLPITADLLYRTCRITSVTDRPRRTFRRTAARRAAALRHT
jgi:hypothetical protein